MLSTVEGRRSMLPTTIDWLRTVAVRDYVLTKTHANADKTLPLESYAHLVASAAISEPQFELKCWFARLPSADFLPY